MSSQSSDQVAPPTLFAPEPPDGDAGEPPRRAILVVDDNEANRYAVSYWLGREGFDVLQAETGGGAIESATGPVTPSLIVLDIRLPDTSGFEVLRRLRDDPRTAQIPVVHLSASFTTSEWRAHGLEAGADAYLTHPVEPRELLATVRALLRVRAAEERVRNAAAEWTATFEALDEPVLLVDVHERIVRGNRAAAFLAYAALPPGALASGADSVAGLALAELAGGPLAPIQGVVRRVLAGAEPRLLSSAVDHASARDELDVGGRRLALVGRPVRDESGGVRGVVCVLNDVTERAMLLEQAEEARLAAEAANRAKSTFLATMSHEIRTPINAILGYADLLDMDVAGTLTAPQRDYLQRLQGSSRHLLMLVDDVLDLSKVDAGQLKVRHDLGDLVPVVDAAVALVAPMAASKGLTLRVEGANGDVRYRGDEHRARQVVLNLLTNAVKFTAPGGEIVVRLANTSAPPGEPAALPVVRYGLWASVAVCDTGIGVPEDRREAIFDPFVQVEEGFTRPRGGTGLGLTISRRLARLMDGDLVLSAADGVGSTFTLWLPASEPRSEPAERDALAASEAGAPTLLPTVPVRGVELGGRAIADGVPALVAAFEQRLREDAALQPVTAHLSPAALLNHSRVLVAEIGSAMIAAADGRGPEAGWLRDSITIRRTVAELHGAQRHRLGWNERHLLREFALLQEELDGAVAARLATESLDAAPALDVVRRLLGQVVEASLWALSRQAVDE